MYNNIYLLKRAINSFDIYETHNKFLHNQLNIIPRHLTHFSIEMLLALDKMSLHMLTVYITPALLQHMQISIKL